MSYRTIHIIDSHGGTLFNDGLQRLPFSEDYIVAKSIELFQQSQPCIIYKSYIISQSILEIDSFLRANFPTEGEKVPWEQMPNDIRAMLD